MGRKEQKMKLLGMKDTIKFNDYDVKVTEDETKKKIDDIAKSQKNFKDR